MIPSQIQSSSADAKNQYGKFDNNILHLKIYVCLMGSPLIRTSEIRPSIMSIVFEVKLMKKAMLLIIGGRAPL